VSAGNERTKLLLLPGCMGQMFKVEAPQPYHKNLVIPLEDFHLKDLIHPSKEYIGRTA
jgi:hypothetical protein